MADDFLKRAFNYWTSQGYAPHQAAALAANMQHESGGSTTILGDKGTSQGLFQWHDTAPGVGRKTNLYNWAKDQGLDPEAEDTQFKFAKQELEGSEKASGDKIKAAQNYQQAQDATMGYLRGQGYTPQYPGGTIAYTNRYNIGAPLAGVDPISAPPVGPPTAVASGPGGAGVVAQTPDDRDLAGYGGSAPVAPSPATSLGILAANANRQNLAGITAQGQGLLAAGAPTQIPQTPQIPMLQAYRPKAQLGAAPFIPGLRGLLG